MRRSRILLRRFREPKCGHRDLIRADEDRRTVRKARTNGSAAIDFSKRAVNSSYACAECIVNHRPELLLFLPRKLVVEERLRDHFRRLHGGVVVGVVREALLLALRRLRVLQGFSRRAPAALELVHHPCRGQAARSTCDQTLPEMTIPI